MLQINIHLIVKLLAKAKLKSLPYNPGWIEGKK